MKPFKAAMQRAIGGVIHNCDATDANLQSLKITQTNKELDTLEIFYTV